MLSKYLLDENLEIRALMSMHNGRGSREDYLDCKDHNSTQLSYNSNDFDLNTYINLTAEYCSEECIMSYFNT